MIGGAEQRQGELRSEKLRPTSEGPGSIPGTSTTFQFAEVYMAKTDRALVLGASVAGLLAARALSDTFHNVVVLDRDELPATPRRRPGVPQGRQVHGLLARGATVLETLFEGITSSLIAGGALSCDIQNDIHWWIDGRLIVPQQSALRGVLCSRPMLEHHIRQRVAALPNVRIVSGTTATGLRADTQRRHITAVTAVSGGEPERDWPAAMVVDATGRGSRLLAWLAALGLPAGETEAIELDFAYVSRIFRRRPGDLGGRLGGNSAMYPGQRHAGFVLAQENDTFINSVSGAFGETPPTDEAGMLAWAETLANPDMAEIMRTAEPISEPVLMRFPREARHRYEKINGLPENLVAVGDALCSFNPAYGQGMTIAALEALQLRDLALESRRDLGVRFWATVGDIIDPPWQMATAGDLALGRSDIPASADSDYMSRLRSLAAVDPVVGRALLRVINLLDPPARLADPEIAARVLGS